ncbi:unnamed protein product [Nezara viridula]|uniref:Carbonic anhydrase n=1 Tax=Nezara viridula TaxID=85310 RepID=A0A9P0MZ86_NEZVI|nr:unnamed protein product [Nezara viridula]
MAKGKKKKTRDKRKRGKGKKKISLPKTELEIKLTEQMMKRVGKKLRPMKVLQEMYKKIMDHYDRYRSKRPVYSPSHLSTKVPSTSRPTEEPRSVDYSGSVGELAEIFFVRRTTMIDKRKGDEDDSPINIETRLVKKCNYLRLSFEGMFDAERKTVITNSGYHVIGSLGGEVLIWNGPLFGKYILQNFHVHYGESRNDGSEHTINGRRFTMEMHMVFLPHSANVDITQESFNMTAKKVVLGLIFKLSRKICYYDLFSVVSHINKKGKSLETSNNLLYDFKDILAESEYYNYSGSGTEGDHKEYEWLLFKKVLPINKRQMQNMWDLRKFDTEKTNVKPTQPLGERTIFTPYYYDHHKCRGKEQCKCFGHSKAFKPIPKIAPLPIVE